MDPYIIPVLSPVWWAWNLLFVSISALFLEFSFKNLRQALGVSLLFSELFLHLYLLEKGVWSVQYHLPLHFCDLMAICSVIALLSRSIAFYEITLLLGFVGPLQAMFTPAFILGSDPIYVVIYFITHTILAITPLFLTLKQGMRPRRGAWWKSALFLMPIILFAMGVNHFVGGNYMFLSDKPEVAHLLNRGPWPLYIVYWIGLFLSVSFVINRVSLVWILENPNKKE